jgi:monovalent cation/hydrogen antiporter
VAGAAIGLAVGFAGRWLRNRIDDPPIEIAGSILLAYAAYLPAEAIHASGVLAAVTAGLYLGWHSSGGAFSARSRLQSGAFWATLVFLVNAVLFVLVGLSFHTFSTRARGPVERLVLTGIAAVAAVIVIRLAWMEATGWLIRLGRRGRAARHPGWRERLVLGWAGMRGAITLAALLAVPARTTAGEPLVGRDDIIYLGFAVIIVTLVGQGMTLPVLVRRLHWLETTADDEDLESEVAATAQAALDMRRDLISFQRRTLGDLRRQGRIGTTALRTIEHDLDLEEARLSSA